MDGSLPGGARGWHRALYGWLLRGEPDGRYAAYTGGNPVLAIRSLGCVLDKDGPGERALDRLWSEDVNPAVGGGGLAQCASWAAGQGKKLFGMEAGGQCYVRSDDDPARAQRWGPKQAASLLKRAH